MLLVPVLTAAAPEAGMTLRQGWAIQSSDVVRDSRVSVAGYPARGWYGDLVNFDIPAEEEI